TAGRDRLAGAGADVVGVVDVLRFSSIVVDAVASGAEVGVAEAETWSRNGAAVAVAASRGSTVLVGSIRNAGAVARAVQTIQERRQARTSVAVIAAGELDENELLRFAVEDQLGAGAVIAALSARGIDHTAPDAAVAAEGFHALRAAVRHMVGASGSGREIAGGVAATARIETAGLTPTTVADAAVLDAVDVVPVLRDGVFTRFE
ncbi:2-phosphosulfolactate phosphatase, partial [Microbacterium oxydans]|uniref:2-phosphosulfolactate phosphatase n=1 Tax=Microbacterium oxydans TaxID=82380 RepID=UPI0024ADD1C8